jgi:hypothetical protein
LISIAILLAIPAPTFNEFGMWYFIFGLFIMLGFVMLGIILLAEPDRQYDIDSIPDVQETDLVPETKQPSKT